MTPLRAFTICAMVLLVSPAISAVARRAELRAAEEFPTWLWLDRDGYCPAVCNSYEYRCPCYRVG